MCVETCQTVLQQYDTQKQKSSGNFLHPFTTYWALFQENSGVLNASDLRICRAFHKLGRGQRCHKSTLAGDDDVPIPLAPILASSRFQCRPGLVWDSGRPPSGGWHTINRSSLYEESLDQLHPSANDTKHDGDVNVTWFTRASATMRPN